MKIIKSALLILVLFLAIPLARVDAGSISTTINNQNLTEGSSSAHYLLNLSSAPSSGNSVGVSWTTNGQCAVAHESGSYVESGQLFTTGSSLVFRARAVDDQTNESTNTCTVTYRTASGDNNLHNLSYAQTFNIYDNGDAVATVPALNATVIGPSSITEGSGALYSFGIGPSTTPEDALVISASTNDGECELVSGSQVTNFIEQTIPAGVQGAAIFTVRTINDSVVEGDHNCSVTHSLRTEDLTYSGITISNTYVPVSDDEASYSSEAVDSEELFKRPEFGVLDAKDANNDGVEDSGQRNLGVFINGVTGRRQAIEIKSKSGNCNAVSTPESKPEDQLVQENDSFVYPHGLINFRIICGAPGAKASVSYYLDEFYNTDDIELQKFGKDSGFVKIEDLKISSFETQNGPVSLLQYDIVDGGQLDEDQQANGIIVDPVGIAISEVEPVGIAAAPATSDQDTKTGSFLWILPAFVLIAGATVYIRKRYLRKRSSMR